MYIISIFTSNSLLIITNKLSTLLIQLLFNIYVYYIELFFFFFRKPTEFIEYSDPLKYRLKCLNTSRILQ